MDRLGRRPRAHWRGPPSRRPRSFESSAAALRLAGAQVQLGTLDDLDVLRDAASDADGVIHLAFKHDLAFSGDFQGAADADRERRGLWRCSCGSERPFVLASGLLG